jgi:ribose transport system substrate-binding protein
MSTTFNRTRTPGGRRTVIVTGAAAAVAALGLAACSSVATTASSGTTGTASATASLGAASSAAATASASAVAAPAAGACGSIPTVAPKDPSGVLAKLPASVAANYDGYTSPVAPSAWANWKPSHAAPYKVAIVWNPPVNTFAVNTLKAMTAALRAAGDVDIISSTAPQSPSDVPGNIALYNQAVAEKPDLIISFPLASGPLIPAVEAAAKKGIPTVSPWVATATPDAVSVGTNDWLQAVTLASKVVTQLKGSGTILEVHGIPGVQEDDDAFAGFKSVLAQCPDITIAGQVTGDYNPAATQQAVLQFLSSHPGKVDGVFEAGTMTAGIIQAFKQLGRPVPVIADLGSTEGSIAYAGENKSTYQEYGASTPDAAIGQTFAKVALDMLDGNGPVLDQLVTTINVIDSGNLSSVYRSGWTLSDTGDAALPNDPYFTSQQLAVFLGGQG